jgi:hypothetical protein
MTLILGVAVLQWAIIAAISFFKRVPKWLVASTLILAVAYVNAFGVRRESAALKAAAMPPRSEGSCAVIEPGMRADVVRAKLGEPHEVRDDGKTRGPAAVTWVYRGSRCAVHLLDEKVELVE